MREAKKNKQTEEILFNDQRRDFSPEWNIYKQKSLQTPALISPGFLFPFGMCVLEKRRVFLANFPANKFQIEATILTFHNRLTFVKID